MKEKCLILEHSVEFCVLLAFGVTTFYILGCWYKRVVLNIGLLIFEASLVFSFNVCIAKRLYQSIDLLAVTNLWSVMYAGRVKGLGQRSSELFYFFFSQITFHTHLFCISPLLDRGISHLFLLLFILLPLSYFSKYTNDKPSMTTGPSS